MKAKKKELVSMTCNANGLMNKKHLYSWIRKDKRMSSGVRKGAGRIEERNREDLRR